jgi:hypothetical protein
LRVPGTVNYKYPDRPLVKLLEMQPGRAYAPADLDKLLPSLPRNDQHVSRDGTGEPPVPLSPADMKAWTGERYAVTEVDGVDRSDTLWWIGCGVARGLRDTPLTNATKRRIIRDATAERDVALGYRKYADRRDYKEYDEIAVGALKEVAKEASINLDDSNKKHSTEHNDEAAAERKIRFRTAREIA